MSRRAPPSLQARPPADAPPGPSGPRGRGGRSGPRGTAVVAALAAALAGCDGGARVSGPPGGPGDGAAGGAVAPIPAGSVTAGPVAAAPGAPVLFADDASAGTVGAPGETVDCAGTLPCRWVDADGAFALAVTRLDNTAREGRLELLFEIDATHDTAPSVGAARAAIGVSGRRVAPVEATLDEAATLAAGARLGGRVEFAAPSADAALADWGVTLGDNGVVRAASFENLPVGPVQAPPVDCAGALPCTWTDPAGLAAVELTAAGGFASERRLYVEARIDAAEALGLVAGPDTSAAAADGTLLRVRQVRIGGRALEPGTPFETLPGAPSLARFDFFRVATSPALLDEVALDLYRDAPVPRWRPRFANVPALAP